MQKTATVKKVCFFCESKDENKQNPSYTDIVSLKKFTTERGKIVAAGRSGACAKHQRKITKQIKYARHLALMPFAVNPY